MTSNKRRVLAHFLRFALKYVPPQEARIATLGGRGWEAELWREAGVLPEKGWLIERGRKARQKLIRQKAYHLCNNLRSFSRSLSAVEGDQAAIDAFHWDLCGIVSDNIPDVYTIMPLLLNEHSQGRCFAVTVIDARNQGANLEDLAGQGNEVLGKRLAVALLQKLEAQLQRLSWQVTQRVHSDPKLGAQREMSLLLKMLHLLSEHNPNGFVPTEMERHIYISDFGRIPNRMRSYFFRFDKPKTATPLNEHLARLWVGANLRYLSHTGQEVTVEGGPLRYTTAKRATAIAPKSSAASLVTPNSSELVHVVPVTATAPINSVATPKEVMMSALEYLVQQIQGPALEEYEALKKKAAEADEARGKAEAYDKLVAVLRPHIPAAPVELPKPKVVAEVERPRAASRTVPAPVGEPPVPAILKALLENLRRSTVKKDLKTACSLEILLATAESDEAVERAIKSNVTKLGLTRLGVGRIGARAKGGHKGVFLYSLFKHVPQTSEQALLMEALLPIYAKVENRAFTMEDLKASLREGSKHIDRQVGRMAKNRPTR